MINYIVTMLQILEEADPEGLGSSTELSGTIFVTD